MKTYTAEEREEFWKDFNKWAKGYQEGLDYCLKLMEFKPQTHNFGMGILGKPQTLPLTSKGVDATRYVVADATKISIATYPEPTFPKVFEGLGSQIFGFDVDVIIAKDGTISWKHSEEGTPLDPLALQKAITYWKEHSEVKT